MLAAVLAFAAVANGGCVAARQPQLVRAQHLPDACPRQLLLDSPNGSVVYDPAEGDLVFLNSGRLSKQVAWFLAASGGMYRWPTHVGIIVRDPRGEPALLQALDPVFRDFGATDEFYRRHGLRAGEVNVTVGSESVTRYLAEYATDRNGTVWVRRHLLALAPEQSFDLTSWSMNQRRKPYALPKLAGPVTGLPTQILRIWPAQTEALSWHCSGLVAAALIRMEYFRPNELRPAFTDPGDLFTDSVVDLSPAWSVPRKLTPDAIGGL